MDPLTEIFRTMHVRAVVQSLIEATAPWGLAHVPKEADQKAVRFTTAITPSELAYFAMISRGSCWLTVNGMQDPIPLVGGDCFLLGPGSSYTLGDNPRTPVTSFCDVLRPDESNVIRLGGGGAPTTIISGFLYFDKPMLKPITQLLPNMTLIKAEQARTLALSTTFQLLASEMAEQAPGSEVVATRLAEVLFIQALRVQMQANAGVGKPGWLRAIFDPQISAALKSLHAHVSADWTVEALAATASMSRSAFAARFKELLGETPLDYVTEWRMQKAIELLNQGDKKLIEVANAVGYETDAAFSKAFKRIVGTAPGEYRKQWTGSWYISPDL
jgi:AraC-like DNA-binding protein